jgi:hypothetical protein
MRNQAFCVPAALYRLAPGRRYGGLPYESIYSAALELLSFLVSPLLKITNADDGYDLILEFSPRFRVIRNPDYKLRAAYAETRVFLLEERN